MRFNQPLIRAKFLERTNRFTLKASKDGEVLWAHCPNSGSMATCFDENSDVFLSRSENINRKFQYTWEISKINGVYVFVDTIMTNKIVIEAIKEGTIKELQGYEKIITEPRLDDKSRLDFKLENARERCYVEIKNATLLHENRIKFPDAKTKRGQKHLSLLKQKRLEGDRAVIFFHVARGDGECFSPAYHIDAEYGELLLSAYKNGVEILAYRSNITEQEVRITEKVAVIL